MLSTGAKAIYFHISEYKFFSVFFRDPEKLFQVAFSLINGNLFFVNIISSTVLSFLPKFPEGWNFSEWREHLSSIPQFADSQLLSDKELLLQAGIVSVYPEGWFFPDTYRYISVDKASDILRRAHQKMKRVLAEEWSGRADGDGDVSIGAFL